MKTKDVLNKYIRYTFNKDIFLVDYIKNVISFFNKFINNNVYKVIIL